MQGQRKVCEQPHIALTTRECSRHRKPISQEPAVIRLAEKIATQQLQRLGGAFYFFYHMRDQISAAVRDVGQACMREVHLIATVGKKRDNQNESGQECGCRDAERPFERPASSFANENGQESVTASR